MDVTDMPAALQAGQIDAFTAWEPTPAIAIDQGIGKILRSYGDITLSPISLHTTKKFAYENAKIVKAFLASQLSKSNFINRNKTRAAHYASQAASELGITISENAFKDLFDRINFTVDLNDAIIEDINDTADFLKNQVDPPLIDRVPILEYDEKYLQAARELQNNSMQIIDFSSIINQNFFTCPQIRRKHTNRITM